jgi:hypothetical protein
MRDGNIKLSDDWQALLQLRGQTNDNKGEEARLLPPVEVLLRRV